MNPTKHPPLLSPQERLRYARRALKQADTFSGEAASLGCMDEWCRARISRVRGVIDDLVRALAEVERDTNIHQSALRARRGGRRAA